MGKLSAAAKVCEELRAKAVDADDDAEEEFKPWMPASEPQWEAVRSKAFEVLAGGAGGGGKSSLLLILATLAHHKSIIFRRVYPNLTELIENSRDILRGSGASYNDTKKRWRNIPGGRSLEFGTLQLERDKEKYRGRAHDLKCFDEVTELTESQYEFVIGWTRSHIPDQRCRVVATCNPPSSKEGRWIVQRWRPWLDPRYEDLTDIDGKPAKKAVSAEVRWFAKIPVSDENYDTYHILKKCPRGSFLMRVFREGKQAEIEVPDGTPFEIDGEEIKPVSRTFIRATLQDNKYLKDSGYAQVLASLPEPLRSQLLKGDFTIGETDQEWQVIPSLWVRQAQSRWVDKPQWLPPLTALGVDVARGGIDNTVLVPVHDWWVAPIQTYPGTTTPDSWTVADHCRQAVFGDRTVEIRIDTGGGYGGGPYDILQRDGFNVISMTGAAAAVDGDGNLLTDKTGTLCFANMRSYWAWYLRDMLDPTYGATLALPPDEEMFEDLTADRYKPMGKAFDEKNNRWLTKIAVESKDELKKADRLGRSPDKGDAVKNAIARVDLGGYDPMWAAKIQTEPNQPMNVWR